MQTYLEPTQESGRALFVRGIAGSVVMLNLPRYRAIVDYSATPQLAPPTPITGEAAYRLYMAHTTAIHLGLIHGIRIQCGIP